MEDKSVLGELGWPRIWVSKEEAKKMFPSNENKVEDLECTNEKCRCKTWLDENF